MGYVAAAARAPNEREFDGARHRRLRTSSKGKHEDEDISRSLDYCKPRRLCGISAARLRGWIRARGVHLHQSCESHASAFESHGSAAAALLPCSHEHRTTHHTPPHPNCTPASWLPPPTAAFMWRRCSTSLTRLSHVSHTSLTRLSHAALLQCRRCCTSATLLLMCHMSQSRVVNFLHHPRLQRRRCRSQTPLPKCSLFNAQPRACVTPLSADDSPFVIYSTPYSRLNTTVGANIYFEGEAPEQIEQAACMQTTRGAQHTT